MQIFKKRKDELLNKKETNGISYRLTELALNEPRIRIEDLKKITASTLVMAGEHDVINEEHTRLIRSSIKDARLYIFKEGDHYVPLKEPEIFNKIVSDFID